jgi:serine protease Do
VGVVSVAPRAIPPSSMLGVSLADAKEGPQIVLIVPDSGAEKAGLQVNDVITHADGRRTASRHELISHVRKLNVGKTVKLNVKRGGKELEITATLGKGEVHFQDRLGGGLSERAAGFPLALQHDTLLRPRHCGGPLVDLDGNVVGINIARAGRVNSYAIPAKSVQELLPDLMAGKFAPPPSATTDVKKEGERMAEKTGG